MSTNGTSTPKDKSKNKGDVDLNNTKRGVWLVKVGNIYEKYGIEITDTGGPSQEKCILLLRDPLNCIFPINRKTSQ